MPLSNESPNQSQEEFVVSENEPNNHLYSLGKFVHIGLHRRHLIVQSQNTTSSPAESTSIPPRRVTVAATQAGLANIREVAGSGSGSEFTSPPLIESSLEVQAVPGAAENAATTAALPPQSHTVTLPSSTTKQVIQVIVRCPSPSPSLGPNLALVLAQEGGSKVMYDWAPIPKVPICHGLEHSLGNL